MATNSLAFETGARNVAFQPATTPLDEDGRRQHRETDVSADGNWKITINTPMGAQELTAAITTSGDTFTGKTEGRMGAGEVSGKVSGDTLTWTTAITQPMPMNLEFEAKIDGDKMSGNVKLGAFGNAALIGVRI